jgi:hypothetical protein
MKIVKNQGKMKIFICSLCKKNQVCFFGTIFVRLDCREVLDLLDLLGHDLGVALGDLLGSILLVVVCTTMLVAVDVDCTEEPAATTGYS